MKKKLLVTGTNMAIVKDFIQHSDRYFKTIGTTDCWHDIEKHFDLFEPEAYLIFPETANDDAVRLINKLKSYVNYNGCPLFMCAPADVCAEVQKSNPKYVHLMLKRPVSADNLSLRIEKYFRDEEKKRIAEEKPNDIDFVPDEEENENRKKHILVVDDDRTILKMLKAALEEKYEVTTMVNGVLVEKFLQSRNVDLIVLDYEMPVKTGADVLRNIRTIDSANKIPICFLTGVADREKIMEILSLNPNAYLLKPVNMEAFLATISNLID